MAQNVAQMFRLAARGMRVFRLFRKPARAAVVIGQEFGQMRIARFPTGDTGRAHAFDQPILQNPVGALYPPFKPIVRRTVNPH
ncbi:MAG: hypothetical protein LBD68_03350 [Zoogloeaceae bacterium]|nr:hypothetical protein [Zoogloeaceae bacterium]